jgi:hypothetical protein
MQRPLQPKRREHDGREQSSLYPRQQDQDHPNSIARKMGGRVQVEELSEQLSGSPDSKFSYKRLEQIRGFLCHLSITFEVITPFLKGFHLTLCSHLSSQDGEGWKLSDGAFLAYIHEKRDLGSITEEEARASLNPPDYADIPVNHVRMISRRSMSSIFHQIQCPVSARFPRFTSRKHRELITHFQMNRDYRCALYRVK